MSSLYDDAIEIIRKENRVSISFVQRKLNIGYVQASQIIEELEKNNIITSPNASGKREVLDEAEMEKAQWIASRPACIQAAYKKYPAGMIVNIDGIRKYLMGYGENDGEVTSLIFSDINPAVDFDGASTNTEHICINCIEQMIKVSKTVH